MSLADGLKDLNIAAEVLGIGSRDVSPVCDVCREMVRARNLHGDYKSRHEGLGVIVGEFEEFLDAIRGNEDKATANEAKQLAAVAMRFYLEFRT